MSTQISTLYPPGGYGAPKNRRGHAKGDVGLPAGTEVFSADNHISVAEDIFYDKFPDDLKEKAPRIWYEDGAYMVGRKQGQTFLPGDFSRVLMQYDDLAGAATNNIEARIKELHTDGVDKELAFPNAVLGVVPLSRQGTPRAGVPDLQRAHGRAAGEVERTLLRRRADQLVGPEGHPADAYAS